VSGIRLDPGDGDELQKTCGQYHKTFAMAIFTF
jgi:hypothetical protein